MNTELTKRPIFKASAESEAAQALLRDAAIGQTITWQQLSAAMKCDAQKRRGCVMTARKTLLGEAQMVFAAVAGIGLKRLSDAEIIAQEGTTSVRVRRTVRGSMKRLATVDHDSLDQRGKIEHNFTAAALGAIALCVKTSSLEKVKQAAIGNGERLNPAKTIALFAS